MGALLISVLIVWATIVFPPFAVLHALKLIGSYGSVFKAFEKFKTWKHIDLGCPITQASFLILLKADHDQTAGPKFWYRQRQIPDAICHQIVSLYGMHSWLHPYLFPTHLVAAHRILVEGLDMSRYEPRIIQFNEDHIPPKMWPVFTRLAHRPELCANDLTATLAAKYFTFWRMAYNVDLTPCTFKLYSLESFGPLNYLSPAPYGTIDSATYWSLSKVADPLLSDIGRLFNTADYRTALVYVYYERIKQWLLEQDFSPAVLAFWLCRLLLKTMQYRPDLASHFVWLQLESIVFHAQSPDNLCPFLMKELFPFPFHGDWADDGGRWLPLMSQLISYRIKYTFESLDFVSLALTVPIHESWAYSNFPVNTHLITPMDKVVMTFSEFEQWWSDYSKLKDVVLYENIHFTRPLRIARLDGITLECHSIIEMLIAISEMLINETHFFKRNLDIIRQQPAVGSPMSKFFIRLITCNLVYRRSLGFRFDGQPHSPEFHYSLWHWDELRSALCDTNILDYFTQDEVSRAREVPLWIPPPRDRFFPTQCFFEVGKYAFANRHTLAMMGSFMGAVYSTMYSYPLMTAIFMIIFLILAIGR